MGGTSLLEHAELRGELGRGGRDSPGVEHRSGVRVRGMDKGKQQLGTLPNSIRSWMQREMATATLGIRKIIKLGK